jgi:hypothetical protein
VEEKADDRRDQAMSEKLELSAADEQLRRDLTERARTEFSVLAPCSLACFRPAARGRQNWA